MFMRYLHLATLAVIVASALSQNLPESADMDRQLSVDFDWGIKPQKGYPAVAFNNWTTTKEVIFQYDSPLLKENKTYGVTIFENDCKTIGSNAITNTADASVDHQLTVFVDIDEGTISDSRYFNAVNQTNAMVAFCLRVDYFWNEESINFHASNLTIHINLLADFDVTKLEQFEVVEDK
jgi:hypothetical protein